jgi:predicted transcriptional regulator of viral defense system
VTVNDIRALVANPRDVMHALVKKRALERVRRGLFLVRPFRTLLRRSTPSSILLVNVLLHDQPHYLGGLWAFTHHHLTTQQYLTVLDAFVTRYQPARDLGAARVRFHVLRPPLLAYGITRPTIEGMETPVSDLERTLLDVLDHPRIAGGLVQGLELFGKGLPRASARTLVRYAVLGSRHSTCQRLGVLLERAKVPARSLSSLQKRVASKSSLLSMIPVARVGRVNKRWQVVENDQ